MKWMRNYDADIENEEYAVLGFRLYDDEYYGEDGMADRASCIAVDKWQIEIYSWRQDFHNKKYKVADHCSDVKLRITFDNKDDANKFWLALKINKPSLEALKNSKMLKEFV